jgi:hypothetical protein
MIKIRKYSGDLEEFDLEKLIFSLSKSGASSHEVSEIIQKIQPKIYDGMHTKDLYKLAFNFLRKKSNAFAARYSLKRAIKDLGPDGFYFEKWAGRIFEHLGYQILNGQVLAGYAVNHEIDVLGLKDDTLLIAECKFRNTTESKISVTTPMYILSRFKDLQGKTFQYFNKNAYVREGWLVTNVYLTQDAKNFSKHYGLQVLSWDYPENNSIKFIVDDTGLYPITCLTNLTKFEKNKLLSSKCILVKDLLDQPEHMKALGFSPSKVKRLIEEANNLLLN